MLIVIIAIGLLTVVVISAGLTDPPLAGARRWIINPVVDYGGAVSTSVPACPFTLITPVTHPAAGSQSPFFEIKIGAIGAIDTQPAFNLYVYADQTYTITAPENLLRIDSHHLKVPPFANEIRLDCAADRVLTVRFNHESVWRSALSTDMNNPVLKAGWRDCQNAPVFNPNWQSFTIYQP